MTRTRRSVRFARCAGRGAARRQADGRARVVLEEFTEERKMRKLLPTIALALLASNAAAAQQHPYWGSFCANPANEAECRTRLRRLVILARAGDHRRSILLTQSNTDIQKLRAKCYTQWRGALHPYINEQQRLKLNHERERCEEQAEMIATKDYRAAVAEERAREDELVDKEFAEEKARAQEVAEQERVAAEQRAEQERAAALRAKQRAEEMEAAIREHVQRAQDLGYKRITFKDFALDGRQLAAVNTKVSITGRYIKQGNMEVIVPSTLDAARTRSTHIIGDSAIGLLTENAARNIRELFWECNKTQNAMWLQGCPVTILGQVVVCRKTSLAALRTRYASPSMMDIQ
jgi:hypothetical protein